MLFNFPLRYLFAIGLETYLKLGVGDSYFHAETNQRYSAYWLSSFNFFLTGVSPFNLPRSSGLQVKIKGLKPEHTPHSLNVTAKRSVCLVPLSFAITHGIAVAFFSCGY